MTRRPPGIAPVLTYSAAVSFRSESLFLSSDATVVVKEALRLGTRTLGSAGIEDAGLEAEVLLRYVLGVDRAHLYLALEQLLPNEIRTTYRGLLARRLLREPLAYIVGHKEFYGIDLYVDRRALIPRPETELLVECALDWAKRRGGETRISDIGTGSGAIAIALALNLPGASICASDFSEDALTVARRNCDLHGVADRVKLLRGFLMAPIAEPVDMIVANLPYVTASQIQSLSPDIRLFEPALALDGGEDGLDLIGRLVASSPSILSKGGALLLEIGQGQDEKAKRIARSVFPDAEVSLVPDFAGIMRVLRIETMES